MRFLGRTTGFAALLVVMGCKALQPEPSVAVQVRDAETKAPIANATVDLSDIRGVVTSKEITGKTGADGVARVHPLPDGTEGLLAVSAAGYLNDAKPLNEAAGMEVELFAGPRPTVELVIPSGFRGLIKAEFKIAPADGAAPSPRLFRCDVQADGTVEVVGPEVLHCVRPQDFHAVAADGTTLPSGGPTTSIELRWVKTTDAIDYFVYGTDIDCHNAQKTLTPSDGGHGGGSGSGKGGGGGRRGGGRRGGGMSGGASP